MYQTPEIKGFLHSMGTKLSNCQERVYANIIQPEIMNNYRMCLGARVLILKYPDLSDCELSTETCSKNVYSLGPRCVLL